MITNNITKKTSWNKGIPMTDEVKRIVSLKLRGIKRGKFSDEHKRKLSEAHKGKISWMKGKHHTEEAKEKNRIKHIGKKRSKDAIEKFRKNHSGEKHHNWKGGISNNPYPCQWESWLLDSIRIRDNLVCQECGIHQDELTGRFKKLDVHHIDYNKENCELVNLISLCRSCHIKTNFNREYWIKYFQKNDKQ